VGSSRTIDVHIRRIRAALAEKSDYEYIHTIRGLGYRFEPCPKGTQEDGEEEPGAKQAAVEPRE
jgi:DNA-binding winged helix-turn-helix (wHTH) protein